MGSCDRVLLSDGVTRSVILSHHGHTSTGVTDGGHQMAVAHAPFAVAGMSPADDGYRIEALGTKTL